MSQVSLGKIGASFVTTIPARAEQFTNQTDRRPPMPSWARAGRGGL
jgi:hypothetical protein